MYKFLLHAGLALATLIMLLLVPALMWLFVQVYLIETLGWYWETAQVLGGVIGFVLIVAVPMLWGVNGYDWHRLAADADDERAERRGVK